MRRSLINHVIAFLYKTNLLILGSSGLTRLGLILVIVLRKVFLLTRQRGALKGTLYKGVLPKP